MINYRKYYWLISIFLISVSSIIAYYFKFYLNKGELTALVDVTFTIIALLIAIFEILMVRSVAEESQTAVNAALGRIAEIMSVSDISKGVKMAYDIQKYLRSDELQIAHIRMQDLKFIVIPLKNDKRFEKIGMANELQEILASLSIDINNIDSLLSGKKNKIIDISKVNGNLENLVSVLIEYENHIKSI